MTQRQLIESTATDIIAAIREHGPMRDVIVPRLEEMLEQYDILFLKFEEIKMSQWRELKYIPWKEMEKLSKDLRGDPVYCTPTWIDGRPMLAIWPASDSDRTTFAVKINDQP